MKILEQFISGEPTGFGADDFISTPITDGRLDDIRCEFDELALRQTTWEPQDPFPEEGIPELKALIARARSLG